MFKRIVSVVMTMFIGACVLSTGVKEIEVYTHDLNVAATEIM